MNIPSSFYAPAQGMANLANSLTNLSSTFIEIDERRRQQEAAAMRLAEVSKFDLYATSAFDNLSTEFEKDGNSQDIIEKYRQAHEEKFRETWDYVNTIDDPILKAMVTKQQVAHQLSYGKKFNDIATKKNRTFALTTGFDLFDSAMKAYNTAITPEEEAMAMTNAANAVNRMEISGTLSPEKIGQFRNLMEVAVSRKEEVKVESIIANADKMQIDERKQFLRDLADPTKYQAIKDPAKRRTYYNQAVTTFNKLNREEIEQRAYSDATKMWPDAEQAKVEVLRPEFMKQYGLDMNQAQNLSQSFSVISAQKKIVDKDRQEKNLDDIRAVAITDPVKALKWLRTAEDVDPKDALNLKTSLEEGMRRMSLMSAQEKALRMDIEDKEKAGIKAEILAGRYKTEQELVNAIISKGLSNTSAFIDDALGNFRGFKKDAGSVNFFKSAEEDWDKLIQTTKSKARKRELQDMKPKMLEGLRQQMEKDGLRVSDPKVFELYQTQRKALTATWVTEAIDTVKSKIGIGGDSFVAPSVPTAPPKELPGGGWQLNFPAPVLDEKTARQRLRDMKVSKDVEEKQIKIYRDKGWIK